jgi:hypothetical protein
MTRIMRVLALSILLILSAFFFFIVTSEQGVHKLLMPGSYDVYLSANNYTAYTFWKWPSKLLNLEQPVQPINVVIIGKDNQLIQPDPRNPKAPITGPLLKSGSNEGRLEFELTLRKPGWYKISCKDKCVLAIVPGDKEYLWFDAEEFYGSHDDLNFDALKH